MRTETREVTEIKTVYIADDGTEYDDEDLCKGHDVLIKEGSLICFDHRYEKCNLDRCTYVDIRTEKEFRDFIEVLCYLGISRKGLDGSDLGVYMYEERGNRWLNISKAVDAIKEEERLWSENVN